MSHVYLTLAIRHYLIVDSSSMCQSGCAGPDDCGLACFGLTLDGRGLAGSGLGGSGLAGLFDTVSGVLAGTFVPSMGDVSVRPLRH